MMLFSIFIIICQFLKVIAESHRYTISFFLQKVQGRIVQDGYVVPGFQGRQPGAVWGGQKDWSLQGVCDDF